MKKIVVLTDFSKAADQASRLAFMIANELNAEILLYNAIYVPNLVDIEGGFYHSIPNLSELEDDSAQRLQLLAKSLRDNLSTPSRVHPTIRYKNSTGSITETLGKLVKQENASMLAIGNKTQKGFLEKLVLGSQTPEVMEESLVPVLIVPEDNTTKSIKKIAFATNFSEQDARYIHFLVTLAYSLNAEIVLAHVFKKDDIKSKESGQEFFKKLKLDINYYSLRYVAVTGENVAKALSEFSEEEEIDMLAIAHREHNFLKKIVGTSNTLEMLKHQKLPLLVFPKGY